MRVRNCWTLRLTVNSFSVDSTFDNDMNIIDRVVG